jgi:hypothetical protein
LETMEWLLWQTEQLDKPLEQPVRVQLQQQWWPHIISSFQHQKYKTKGITQGFNLVIPTNFTALSWAPYPFMNNLWNTDELQNRKSFYLGCWPMVDSVPALYDYAHMELSSSPAADGDHWNIIQWYTKISKQANLWRKTPFLDTSTKRRNCIYLLCLPICLPLTYPCKNKTEWPFRSAVIVSSQK